MKVIRKRMKYGAIMAMEEIVEMVEKLSNIKYVLPDDPKFMDLLPYTWIKNKKHWKNKNRLRNKFIHNLRRYTYKEVYKEYTWKLLTNAFSGCINGIMNHKGIARQILKEVA